MHERERDNPLRTQAEDSKTRTYARCGLPLQRRRPRKKRKRVNPLFFAYFCMKWLVQPACAVAHIASIDELPNSCSPHLAFVRLQSPHRRWSVEQDGRTVIILGKMVLYLL
mgnify:CR=1 FL=1